MRTMKFYGKGGKIARNSKIQLNLGNKGEDVIVENKFCVKCGSELGEGIKFCTNCGTLVNPEASHELNGGGLQSITQKAKSLTGTSKVVIGVVIGLCAIIGLLFGTVKTTSSPALQIKAAEMIDDYIRDQASAETKYKDKKVSITGRLTRKNQFNNSQNYAMYIADKTIGERTYTIVIEIPKEQVDAVNKVKIGDFVSAEGTCVGIVKQSNPTEISVQIHSTKVNQ